MDTITLKRLGPEDAETIIAAGDAVFDNAPDAAQTLAFLKDGRNVMIAAFAADIMVAMASGTILLHPDKKPAFFIAEVGTRDDWLRCGIATRVVAALIECARGMDCDEIWLATETDNTAARGLYRKLGGTETEGIVMYDWNRTTT